MGKLTQTYVIGIVKSLATKDLTAEEKEQRATAFFRDITGDFRSEGLSYEEVKFLHKLIRTILGWDF